MKYREPFPETDSWNWVFDFRNRFLECRNGLMESVRRIQKPILGTKFPVPWTGFCNFLIVWLKKIPTLLGLSLRNKIIFRAREFDSWNTYTIFDNRCSLLGNFGTSSLKNGPVFYYYISMTIECFSITVPFTFCYDF